LEAVPGIGTLPAETGIADWMMDTIVEEERRETGDNALLEHWNAKSVKNEQDGESHCPLAFQPPKRQMSTLRELHAIPKFESSFWTQLRLLTARTIKQQRGERLTRVAALLTLAYVLFTGLFWWRMPDNTSRIYQRNSLLFFLLIALSNGVVLASMTVFQQERALLERERAKKLYRVLPYFLAKTASDMTNTVLLPCINVGVVYWVANLRPTAVAFLQFLLAFYLTLSTAQSMGLFLSIAIPSMSIALIIAPAITLFFMIMGGFYIPFQNMYPFLQGLSWLSFARYGYSSFIVNEYAGRDIPCVEGDAAISIGSGECPLPGEEVIAALGIDGLSTSYWFDVGILLVMQLFFRGASYGLLRRHK
jgi:ABC-type multidrug transport system permease subunit